MMPSFSWKRHLLRTRWILSNWQTTTFSLKINLNFFLLIKTTSFKRLGPVPTAANVVGRVERILTLCRRRLELGLGVVVDAGANGNVIVTAARVGRGEIIGTIVLNFCFKFLDKY